ncbi:unnamed protein product [Darwinula stevensoni]|uniref:Deacetylase sirtuin-type domain-containing protein n=1 Tax=Darwinula stevensoni TaxID=69355 RepID=A0A7R9A7E0_9CRUS|nr:unnamed protein product [Darwinula stevensoni]CAG0891370.1 unnamed protein product [Darwinula stevensoni]
MKSPNTGLYANLAKYNLPYPEAIFDIQYFHMDPRPFYHLAHELYPDGSRFRPNICHYFIRLLQEKNILLKLYTQNIDGLERMAGILPSNLIEAHGTFATAHCIRCDKEYSQHDLEQAVLQKQVPKCKEPQCQGTIKPDIVFFGENLPESFHSHPQDAAEADLLIVMGTSLEIEKKRMAIT